MNETFQPIKFLNSCFIEQATFCEIFRFSFHIKPKIFDLPIEIKKLILIYLLKYPAYFSDKKR